MGLLRFERKSMAAETMFSPVEGVRKSSFSLIQDVQRFLNRLLTGISTRAFTAVLRMILLNLFIRILKESTANVHMHYSFIVNNTTR